MIVKRIRFTGECCLGKPVMVEKFRVDDPKKQKFWKMMAEASKKHNQTYEIQEVFGG